MNDELESRTELERQLVQAHQGEVPGPALMQLLLSAQLFMPVRDEMKIAGFQASQRAEPLSLQAEDGTQVLILFTSPERAKPFLEDFPGYRGGILEDLKWILKKMGAGYGIAINPGWEYGLDLEPDMVTELARTAVAED